MSDYEVHSLKCELESAPLAVASRKPRLRWCIRSSQNGEKQQAYRLLVASDPDRLEPAKADLWDTDRIPSRDQEIVYEGVDLAAGQTVYWLVRSWGLDGAGEGRSRFRLAQRGFDLGFGDPG